MYLNTILSQHQQLKQIQNINNKMIDDNINNNNNNNNYILQLTKGFGINEKETNLNFKKEEEFTKEDILRNNLNLAAKIREANTKLFSYIILLIIKKLRICWINQSNNNDENIIYYYYIHNRILYTTIISTNNTIKSTNNRINSASTINTINTINLVNSINI